MNVLSLFDGMSCGQIALNRAGVYYQNYYASEVDKHAIKVTMANYPSTMQLGSVVDIDADQLPFIDLVIGGSPCQGFSFSGKRRGMVTKDKKEVLTLEHYLQLKSEGFQFDGQSYLFWEYVRILFALREKNPQIKFLLENVRMSKKWKAVLTQVIGVEPVFINSALVSAQSRPRLYWTNIAQIETPEDRQIFIRDILQPEDEIDERYYLSDKMVEWLVGSRKKKATDINDKAACFTAGGNSGGLHSQMDIISVAAQRGRYVESGTQQMLEERIDGKSNCLTTVQKDNMLLIEEATVKGYCEINPGESFDSSRLGSTTKRGRKMSEKSNCLLARARQHEFIHYEANTYKLRRFTPIECERLQTVPDNYTAHVSDSQRYRMLGNGWNVDTIVHILELGNLHLI